MTNAETKTQIRGMQHTPTPWTNPTDGGIKAPAECTTLRSGRKVPFRVCTMQDGDRETVRANAAFIVRACNAHDELVAALREMTLCFGAGPESEEWWEVEHDRRGPGGDGLSSEQIRKAVIERARAALAND